MVAASIIGATEAASAFEISVNFYQTAVGIIPEGSTSSYLPPREPEMSQNNCLQ
jgi:hypothetical protein